MTQLVGYKGAVEIDAGWFYCLYIPGATRPTEEELAQSRIEAWVNALHEVELPTPIQQRIMKSMRKEVQ